MQSLLVTGGAGFIGSNFVRYWLENYPDDKVTVLDALTYAGNLESLIAVEKNENYQFVKGDIRDFPLVTQLANDADIIVHFAAESHVDRSILGPQDFIDTNIKGTFILLEAVRKCWEKDFDKKRFIHISTDEVYGSLDFNDPPFTEESQYKPNSPYSASKASSDHLVRAYNRTYSVPAIITHCSNNYGPYQFPEKLIPLMILKALKNEKLPVYGDGKNVRDWIHVIDHCRAIDVVIKKGKIGDVYNIGGDNEKPNIEIVNMIVEKLGRSKDLIQFVKDRPGHDRRYAIDISKIKRQLGWSPEYDFDKGLDDTIKWYIENEAWVKSCINGDYLNYYERNYAGRI
ncbi:TPA: dTDP-glucose 4,6-dehydratase [Candidatus Poribacteria bacterium]|nr:dTDP-glucose 4,6-dehydratase [Candidatus Poribacteria bacterium]